MTADTRWLDDDEQRVWRAYLAVSRKLFAAIDRQMQDESGIPQTYYIIMAMLSEAPGRSLRMSELADIVSSSPSRLSHAVDRLEERGWVRREDCPTDKRGQLAVLTDEGFAALAAAAPGHVEAVRGALFDALDPEQIRWLGTISQTLADHLASGERRTG